MAEQGNKPSRCNDVSEEAARKVRARFENFEKLNQLIAEGTLRIQSGNLPTHATPSPWSVSITSPTKSYWLPCLAAGCECHSIRESEFIPLHLRTPVHVFRGTYEEYLRLGKERTNNRPYFDDHNEPYVNYQPNQRRPEYKAYIGFTGLNQFNYCIHCDKKESEHGSYC